MMIHSQFDPIAISIGPVVIRWYVLSYIVGFMLFLWLGRRRIKQGNTVFTQEMLDDFLTWGVVGVILGGRLGYVLFYKLSDYLAHPLDIFKVWEGGMSFHGGFLGVVIAMWLFSRKHKISTLKTMDFVAPLVPLGLASGRIGNFINGELWGRITDINAFWAMGFPQARAEDLNAAVRNPLWAEWMQQYHVLPRHPSQLYQFALEGICLFIVVWIFSKKRPRPAWVVVRRPRVRPPVAVPRAPRLVTRSVLVSRVARCRCTCVFPSCAASVTPTVSSTSP